MKKAAILFTLGLQLLGCNSVPYQQAVSGWKSHDDVAKWLQLNFQYDMDRQRSVIKRLREQGPEGLLARKPEKLYSSNYGYCVDSANFALQQLNRINPNYNARWVFVRNGKGRPHHWVTAYDYQGKLYIMDYGAGPDWSEMKGTHGPYESLDEYAAYLATLHLDGFEVAEVSFRDMPGQED